MARRLPPFAALRAFEAVARHLSFTRAAEELGVTQAAISRQVRALEDELGVVLVDRQPTHNALTAPGLSLFGSLRDSLDRMAESVHAISARPGRAILTISVAPFFSSCWLTPRIMNFIAANPKIDLRLHHAYAPPDYRRDQIDLGINWGGGDWPGVTAERFLDGSLIPVCAPSFVARCGGLNVPSDLIGKPLFYEFRAADWRLWFAAAGVTPPASLPATHLDDSNALRRVALDGHGVALFFRTLVEEDLAIGRLVQPFAIAADTGDHYFVNYPSDRDLSSGAKTFRRWLFAELAQRP